MRNDVAFLMIGNVISHWFILGPEASGSGKRLHSSLKASTLNVESAFGQVSGLKLTQAATDWSQHRRLF